MNRRKFIRNSSTVLLPAFINGFGIKAFGKEHLLSSIIKDYGSNNDNILVLVQLAGGNDGLNTVIPINYYDKYFKARSNIAIAENKILPLTQVTSCGFHPAINGLRDLYNDGKLAVLQSVGYPQPNFSHFRSSDIWMSGSDASQSVSNGWLGRYLNNKFPDYPAGFPNSLEPDPLAIQIGTSSSLALQGIKTPMAVNITDLNNIHNIAPGFTDKVNDSDSGRELNFIRFVAQQAQAYGVVLKKASGNVEKQAAYPDNKLAAQLKIVAGLIKGGLKTRIYMVSYEGFDKHALQVSANDTSTGSHAELLTITSEAIKAFQNDLEFLGISDRVTGMTFSEFGRRIASNDSLGTDHGAAAPLFVFGSAVKGGFIGTDPVIPDKVTNDDNIPMQIDFRQVYSTILTDWMKVPVPDMNSLLFRDYKALPIFR